MERRDELLAGMKKALPIVFGYLPIGMAYGILAVQSGLDRITAVLMSVLVFAGSSQLIAVNMLAGSTGILPVVMMTFLVNIRHLLMSASLSLHFKQTDRRLLPFIGFLITDESFAVGSTSLAEHENREYYFFGLAFTAYLSWVVSSWIGVSLGGVLEGFNLPGLDYVLPAMFVALLVMQINRRLDLAVAILSGLLSLLFVFILPANWNIILATVLAATVGVIVERWR